MTREEIDNLFVDFDEMGFCPTTLCKDAEEYAIEWRNNIRNAIAKHETDLLKEFVEWYKKELKVESNRWIQYFAKKTKYLENKVEPAEIKSLNAFANGKEQGFDDVIDNIDNDLKKFLEGKEDDETRNHSRIGTHQRNYH